LLTGLGGYSGENDPPNYGDFEAHRNWMSLTYRRKAEAWYREPTQNIWWRLDYPPFAGYLSYFFAMFMRIVVPEGLVVQRGFESTGLRLFMRMTVLASDLLFFYVPVIILLKMFKLNQRLTNTLLLLILCVPGFVLVDHGHFQYNCVMLGLVLAAYIAIVTDHDFVLCPSIFRNSARASDVQQQSRTPNVIQNTVD
jgi:alpha-1,3-glucosyltransferase